MMPEGASDRLPKESGVSKSLGFAALNALSAHVAVLDGEGRIVLVNEAWRRFSREHGGDQSTYYVGRSYLEVCELAARQGDTVAAQVGIGIRQLLQGAGDEFSTEYALRSPNREMYFQSVVRRFTFHGQTYLVASHEDITARKDAEIRLRQAESTLRNVLETLPVGVWIMDGEGLITLGNAAGKRIWGGARLVRPEEFGEYKGWWLSTGQPLAAEDWAAWRAIRKGETSIDEEIRIQCFDGTSKIILNSAVPLLDDEGRITGAIIVNQDITSRMEYEEQLRETSAALDATNRELQLVLERERRNARTDELTGLSNRRHFFELADEVFAIADRYGTPLSVLLLDVDKFKKFNDRYGHQAGDKALETIAHTAREHLRHSDVVARYGGEEFVMVLPNTDLTGARVLAETVRERIASARIPVDGPSTRVTVSIGVAERRPGDKVVEDVVRRADNALYAAKAAGRNCTRMYSEPSPPNP